MSEKKLVEEKCIRISGIELESSIEPTRIDKARFKTNIGDITWKPTRKETTVLEADGFNVRRTQNKPIFIKDLPQIIFNIRDGLKSNGNVSVKTDYTEWRSPNGKTFHIFDDKQINEIRMIDNSNIKSGLETSGEGQKVI